MSKFRNPTLAFSMLCTIALSTAAQAQVAGTYSGTTADGQLISLTVGTDSSNQLAVTGASVGISAPCKGGSLPVLNTGWGFGLDAVITSHHTASFDASDPYYYFNATMRFSGSTVTGTIMKRSSDLDPANTPPIRVDFCESPAQAFSASIPDSPASAHIPAPAAHVATGPVQ